MKITINGSEFESDRIKITINGIDYRIHADKFNRGIVVNKYSDDDSSISITPNVSNEIIIK